MERILIVILGLGVSLSLAAAPIPPQETISVPVSPEQHHIQLEKVLAESATGAVTDVTDKAYFSWQMIDDPERLRFVSQRNLNKFQPGTSYLATYGIYQGNRKVDEVSDLIKIAHRPQKGLLNRKEAGQVSRLYTFSKTQTLTPDNHDHRYLLALPTGFQELKLTLKSKATIEAEIYDTNGGLLAQGSTISLSGQPLDIIEIRIRGHVHENSGYELEVIIEGQPYLPTEEIEDGEFVFADPPDGVACRKASKSQMAEVNRGNRKKSRFLTRCRRETGSSAWCDQVIQPNPDSRGSFSCTYGQNQVHQLIHPSTGTWSHAITAIKIINELKTKNIDTCRINNWWRPEPYNKNVGGSPTRHPYGTAVDVKFCSKDDQNKAFTELCKLRRRGRVKAIGYYAGTVLHFGVGDRRGNTWGRNCE